MKVRCWYGKVGGDTDGLIAKCRDAAYQSGGRDAMVKIKPTRTADCVVGGFRYSARGKSLGSLLLGLYDSAGLLDHIGFTSTIREADRAAVLRKVEKLREPPGFTVSAPGGPSRWNGGRSTEWEPLRPSLVCGSGIRPLQRRPLSPRHDLSPLAAGQGSRAMHLRSDSACTARRAEFHWSIIERHQCNDMKPTSHSDPLPVGERVVCESSEQTG